MKRLFAILAMLATTSSAQWAAEWDSLTSYDNAKLYTITCAVQQITRTLYFGSNTQTRTYLGAAMWHPSANVLNDWTYTATNFGSVGGVSATTIVNAVAIQSWTGAVSVSDRMMCDISEILFERATACAPDVLNVPDFARAESKDEFPSVLKAQFYNRTDHTNFLHEAKRALESIIIGYRDLNGGSISTYYNTRARAFSGAPRLTVSNVLQAIGAPTNYFEWTPDRDWEGRFTNYTRTVQNQWTLTHDGTSTFRATYGEWFTFIGTNGQLVSAFSTNNNIVAGRSAADYGMRYFKPIVTLLKFTERDAAYYGSFSWYFSYQGDPSGIGASWVDAVDTVAGYENDFVEWPPPLMGTATGIYDDDMPVLVNPVSMIAPLTIWAFFEHGWDHRFGYYQDHQYWRPFNVYWAIYVPVKIELAVADMAAIWVQTKNIAEYSDKWGWTTTSWSDDGSFAIEELNPTILPNMPSLKLNPYADDGDEVWSERKRVNVWRGGSMMEYIADAITRPNEPLQFTNADGEIDYFYLRQYHAASVNKQVARVAIEWDFKYK